MSTFLQLPFGQVTRILELHNYLAQTPAGSLVTAKAFAHFYEGISVRQASRDFDCAVALGLPLVKMAQGYRIKRGSGVIVLPMVRASADEITALRLVAGRYAGCPTGLRLSRLADILAEIQQLAPPDPPPAGAMRLHETARLALLDELLQQTDGCPRQAVADRLFGGQVRAVGRAFDHLDRLGGEIGYDPVHHLYYQAAPFYFGVAFLELDVLDALDKAITVPADANSMALLQVLRWRLDDALETLAANTCLDSCIAQSAAVCEVIERYHEWQNPVCKQPGLFATARGLRAAA